MYIKFTLFINYFESVKNILVYLNTLKKYDLDNVKLKVFSHT